MPDIPDLPDLLVLRDHCLEVIAQAEASERRLKRTQGAAELLATSPEAAQALLTGAGYWTVAAKVADADGPLGNAGQQLLASFRPEEKPSEEKQPPVKRGRGRPRSREALSAETRYNLFWVYILAVTPCTDPERLVFHLTRPRQDIRVRTFFNAIKPFIRFNLNAEQAVEHCAAAFGIGQRRVREIVAEVRGGNLVDEPFQRLLAMIKD